MRSFPVIRSTRSKSFTVWASSTELHIVGLHYEKTKMSYFHNDLLPLPKLSNFSLLSPCYIVVSLRVNESNYYVAVVTGVAANMCELTPPLVA